MPQKKIQYKDYADYLKSDKWAQVKKYYAENEQTEDCLCCDYEFNTEDRKPNFHHFKYPKDWNNDSWENLIIVCSRCHEHIHVSIEHNSEDISLRSYLIKLNSIVSEVAQLEALELEYESLWCNSEGEFMIYQKGLNSRKRIKISFDSQNKGLVEYFERRRDFGDIENG